jgi:deoxyribonuclease-4
MIYGLHISTAGSLVKTPARARQMGADVIQIFASNPRGWRPTVYSQADADAFRLALKENNLTAFAHMIYLVNFGGVDDELRQKSITALSQTLAASDLLGLAGVITHLGSHKGLAVETALENVIGALKEAMKGTKSPLIIEIAAGSGSVIADTLDEIAYIVKGLSDPRVGVCIDTAHTLASGYEIRTPAGFDKFLAEFEEKIGLDKLVAMHLNDSKIDLGGRVDRHENIGDGYIGNEGFKVILNHPKLANVPGMLEVPGLDDKGPDQANLDRLRSLTND